MIRLPSMFSLTNPLLIILCVLLPRFIHAQDERTLISQVKEKLEKVKNYTAEGRMKIDISYINAPEAAVKIYFKQPDHFKVVKEGGISVLPKGGVNVNLGSLFADNNFTIVPAGEAVVNGKKLVVVKLLPLADNADIVLTTLFIDKEKKLVKKAAITTKENGSYQMELIYGKFQEWALPDKVNFTFNIRDYQLPKGMTFEYEKSGTASKKKSPENTTGRVELVYTSYRINKEVADNIFE